MDQMALLLLHCFALLLAARIQNKTNPHQQTFPCTLLEIFNN